MNRFAYPKKLINPKKMPAPKGRHLILSTLQRVKLQVALYGRKHAF